MIDVLVYVGIFSMSILFFYRYDVMHDQVLDLKLEKIINEYKNMGDCNDKKI